MTKTAQCGLCKRQLKYHVQPNRITRIVLCEHCGETTVSDVQEHDYDIDILFL